MSCWETRANAAALAVVRWVLLFGKAVLDDARVVLVRAPLLQEQCGSDAAALCDCIALPLWVGGRVRPDRRPLSPPMMRSATAGGVSLLLTTGLLILYPRFAQHGRSRHKNQLRPLRLCLPHFWHGRLGRTACCPCGPQSVITLRIPLWVSLSHLRCPSLARPLISIAMR